MNNIFVGNLSPDATKQDIRSMFDTHGTVERFRRIGRPASPEVLRLSR